MKTFTSKNNFISNKHLSVRFRNIVATMCERLAIMKINKYFLIRHQRRNGQVFFLFEFLEKRLIYNVFKNTLLTLNMDYPYHLILTCIVID